MSISVTAAIALIITWHMLWNRDSISCSVPRISIPKDWSAILIFQMRNPSILMSASYWSGAIRKKVLADIHTEGYIRFVDQAAAFDYIEYGSYDTYELSFRILRFPISTSTYECIVTNLPRDEFPVERIKTLYNARWSIESSFRKLKYTIGLSNFHAYKPEYVKQEIWARLLASL